MERSLGYPLEVELWCRVPHLKLLVGCRYI